MGPDPTRAYFWRAVNKRPTCLQPGYFPTQPEEIFFWPKGNKIEKFDVFGGNYPNSNPNHKWLTRPDQGQKFLTQTHHYLEAQAPAFLIVNFRKVKEKPSEKKDSLIICTRFKLFTRVQIKFQLLFLFWSYLVFQKDALQNEWAIPLPHTKNSLGIRREKKS